MCRLSGNLDASTSWNAKGLSRPVRGFLTYRNYSNGNSFVTEKFQSKFNSDLEDSCDDTDEAVADNRQELVLQLWGWTVVNSSSPKEQCYESFHFASNLEVGGRL
jgi:hypothetical protein